jgi:hypothetical protein
MRHSARGGLEAGDPPTTKNNVAANWGRSFVQKGAPICVLTLWFRRWAHRIRWLADIAGRPRRNA